MNKLCIKKIQYIPYLFLTYLYREFFFFFEMLNHKINTLDYNFFFQKYRRIENWEDRFNTNSLYTKI